MLHNTDKQLMKVTGEMYSTSWFIKEDEGVSRWPRMESDDGVVVSFLSSLSCRHYDCNMVSNPHAT
jgi:hypothetical protein